MVIDMKVRITTDKGTEEFKIDGNTIMPWYIKCQSITITDECIEFRLLGKYTTRVSYSMDGEKLWIMGKDAIPVTEGGEPERMM